MNKCWSEEILDKLPQPPIVVFDDGHVGIIESINEDGTVTVIESNNKIKIYF